MGKKIKKRLFPLFSLFGLFLQSFSPLLFFVPSVQAQVPPQLQVSYSSSSLIAKVSGLKENSSLNLEFYYWTGEAIKNIHLENLTADAFGNFQNSSDQGYAGTATETVGLIKNPDPVIRVVTKLKTADPDWSQSQSLENQGSLVKVQEEPADTLDLTPEEEQWLQGIDLENLEKDCLPDGYQIIDSTQTDWNIDLENNNAQTKEKVKQ